MILRKTISLLGLLMGTQLLAYSESCVDIVPDKRDFIISSQLLREVVVCLEKKIPKPIAMPDVFQSAIQYDAQTYILPLHGQQDIVIRQLDRFEQTYEYQITFYNIQGKIVKNISKKFKNIKTETINMNREKIDDVSYAIVKISATESQKPPMAIIFAS